MVGEGRKSFFCPEAEISSLGAPFSPKGPNNPQALSESFHLKIFQQTLILAFEENCTISQWGRKLKKIQGKKTREIKY